MNNKPCGVGGKSFLVKQFMSAHTGWKQVKLKKTLVASHLPRENLYVLGDYSDNTEMFAGTDRLSMAVQPEAMEFLSEIPTGTKVLFEGARLFNPSFFYDCMDEDIGFEILFLTASPKVLKERHKVRGDNQTAKFLRTQETKSRNVIRAPNRNLWRYVRYMKNETEQDSENIILRFREFIGGN